MRHDVRTSGGAGRPSAFWFGVFGAVAMLLVAALAPTATAAQAWAPPQTVFVPRTGHTVDGLFLETWREGRALLGDPVTEEVRRRTDLGGEPDATHLVQYFENAALVFLPRAPAGEQVRTLALGRESLDRALNERPAAALLGATRRTACSAASGCRGFRSTGHTLGDGFRAFWEAAGEERLLGLPLTEAFRGPDGTWIQYFERAVLRAPAGRDVEPLALGAAAAKRLGLETARVRRPAAVPVYAASLFLEPVAPEPLMDEIAPEDIEALQADPNLVPEAEVVPAAPVGPGPQQGAYQEIVVSLSAQTLWAYEGAELVNSTLVSTGTAEVPATTTPVGSHSILSKVDVQNMEGTISGEYYFVPDVPYVMYFDNQGNALHGTYWHSNFGAPMSHGCINLPMDVASWMYGWASTGTAVTVLP